MNDTVLSTCIKLIIILSAALQLVAATYAVILIKVTGRKLVWLLMCAAFVLMVVRRVISYNQVCAIPELASCDLVNEIVGLVISMLMVLGVFGARHVFVQQQRAEGALREFNRLKISALQGRADPHFLFNTINSIAYLIAEKKPGAEEALHKLSDLYRYIVDMTDRDTVCLEEALRILQAYFDLEQLRFGDRLKLLVTTDGDCSRVHFPGLTLQPIVENSIKHGLGPRGGRGTVTIAVKVENERARIAISDDGVGSRGLTAAQGHGLRIVRARLEHCFGTGFSMDVESVEGSGTKTVISIPLQPSSTART